MISAMRQSHFGANLSMALAAVVVGFTVSVVAETVDLNSAKPALIFTQTGQGRAVWTIEQDPDTPGKPTVLKQSGQAAYPICIKDDARLKDGFVQVQFKPISGKEDQAGGVIWRVKDQDNYYVCRANALEDNVVLYKTVGGKRSVLEIVGRKGGYGVKEKVAPAQWHTLRVEFKGNRFKVIFDGKHLFDVEDSTFTESGKVGLWTKADSVTLFKDFCFGNGK